MQLVSFDFAEITLLQKILNSQMTVNISSEHRRHKVSIFNTINVICCLCVMHLEYCDMMYRVD